jgi:NitT/TauT family transport system substrate-binding protein
MSVFVIRVRDEREMTTRGTMSNLKNYGWSRREFLSKAALAGAGTVLGLRSESLAADPPPETTKLRIGQSTSACQAPLYVAEELLRTEGFSDVTYVKQQGVGIYKSLASGEVDISVNFVPGFILEVDAGNPVVLLGGVHVGCLELFGTEKIHSLRDLKGKTVAVSAVGAPGHIFLAAMLTYVGLNPRQDVHWITQPFSDSVRLLSEGKIDAFMIAPTVTQELRAKKIGHVVVNNTIDRPWSQYFCCMVAANREFVRKNPVATKRAFRAVLKGDAMCALEPERSAKLIVDKGITTQYDYALQMMKELPYGKWREYDPEDTVRFYSLRLNEAGMVKSSPQKIIAQGTDWRFLRELKKELKT